MSGGSAFLSSGAISCPTAGRRSVRGPPLTACLALGAGRIPTRIELTEEGRIRFRGLLRRIDVQATEIESIKPRAQLGLLSVKHSGGRILLINQFDGFHEFLVELKGLNPSVELRGC